MNFLRWFAEIKNTKQQLALVLRQWDEKNEDEKEFCYEDEQGIGRPMGKKENFI